MSKKILVTGGAGYIGSHTVVQLVEAGFSPIIVDDFRNSEPFIIDRINELTKQSIPFYQIDCNNTVQMEQIFTDHPDLNGVIHFAAYKAVGESVSHPLMYYKNNVGSLVVLLELMEKYKVKNLVFSSSCTVYGEPDSPVVTENTLLQKATSPYGETKSICENIINHTKATSNTLQAVLLRYFNPVGAHPSATLGELPQGIPNNLLPYLTQTANGIRKELTVYGDDYDNTKDGTCVRDYIHVVDLANAHVKSLEWLNSKTEPIVETFNIGTGSGNSVLEVITTFESVNNVKVNYRIGPKREGDVEQIYANASKAKRILGWECQYTLADSLKHSWEWEKSISSK
jgi:UDP-glucose 4-epimerase